jgi:RNA polymerase sigma-70 factor (sigma-E family)
VRASEEAAFREYAAARSPGLLRTAYLLSGDWHRAEDIVSAAVVKLYVSWARASRVEYLDAYARQIVVRTYLDERRRPWRREHPAESLPEPAVAAEGPAADTDRRLDLRRQLARMPGRQRAVLVLRFYEDLSVEQTAELMNCSTGAVKQLTTRALSALRGLLALEEAL